LRQFVDRLGAMVPMKKEVSTRKTSFNLQSQRAEC
jgi:hypothetical protein